MTVRPLLCRLVPAAVLFLALAGAVVAQPPDVTQAIAAESAALSRQSAETTAALAVASAELAGLDRAKSDLDARMQRVERRAEVHAIGPEFARTLVEQLRELQRPGQFDAAREARTAQLTATSEANLRAEQTLRGLDDLDAAVARRMQAVAPATSWEQRQQVEAAVRAALAEQRDLLGRLTAKQLELLVALRQADGAEREIDGKRQAAQAKLTQTLYWIPAPPSFRTASEIGPALAWTVSPANWRAVARTLANEFRRSPLEPAVVLLFAAVLLAARGRLQRALVALAPAAVTYQRYRIGYALAALACTAGLALPGPLLLFTAAALLGSAPDADLFVLAVGDALGGVSKLLFALSALAWLIDRRGVAVSHFGADEASLGFAARALRRFAAFLVPLMFVAALNGLNYAPWANRESLGRLGFSIAMVATAAFLAHLLRRRSPLMAYFAARSPRSLAINLHGLWLGVLVALPLAIAALAAAGYFVVAAYFFSRLLMSLFVVLGAVALYGLMALWVQLRRFHLARRHNEEAARAAAAEAMAEPDREGVDVPPPRIDLAAIGEQTRSLLDLLVTLLLLAALWSIWKDALPNLSVAGNYALWTATETVNGEPVTRQLTVYSLLLAFLATAVTIVVVRNVGALLDISLLQRFDMQADAIYAVKVITRYAIAAAGILLVSRILGIAWGDAQWLVAALGVGLGFGLQEIVANFVSGLIVLAERPVRIGDTVTVGDITGTVSSIRARSTRVIDGDNREVIIPNKAFITDRVVNWTLSTRTTRALQLKVGVAHGSDLSRVQQLLLEAARSNADVLPAPPPSVLFVGFGDSSLNFEIRAFVDSLDKRSRVQHEIYLAVERALRGNGIEIPFPQRELHIRSAPGLAGDLQGPRAG